MPLELMDVQSSAIVKIESNGATFGREGSTADIKVPDKTVSNNHAKIYRRGNDWILEDLRSSNGTFVNKQKLTGSTTLQVGHQFSLSRYSFIVVSVDDKNDATKTAAIPFAESNVEPTTSIEPETTVAPLPITPALETEVPSANNDASNPPTIVKPNVATDQKSDDTAMATHVGHVHNYSLRGACQTMFKQVPRNTGIILRTSLKLTVQPQYTVQKGIEDQKIDVLDAVGVIGFVLPASILVAIATTFGIGVSALLHHSLGNHFVASLLIPLLITFVGSIIAGFVFHPVIGGLVKILKGQSSAHERSNYLVMAVSVMPIAAFGTLLNFLPSFFSVRLLAVLPFLFSVLLSLLTTYVSYRWFRHFAVAKWFQIGLWVICGLANATSARGLYYTLRPALVPSGSFSPTSASTPHVSPAPPNLAPTPTEVKSAPAEPITTQEKATTAPLESKTVALTAYQLYVERREFVEATVAADPSVLKTSKKLLALYTQLHRESAKIRQKVKNKAKKAGPDRIAQEAVQQHLRNAETFEATHDIVDKLYEMLKSPQ